MKNKYLVIPIATAFFLASCAKHKIQEVPETQVAGNEYTHASDRAPTSSIDKENLEFMVQKLLDSNKPEEEFLKFLDDRKDIYLRAWSYVSLFDKEVLEAAEKNQEHNLNDSVPYKKLLALWNIAQRTEEKLTYFYVRLVQISYDKSEAKEKRDRAKKVRLSFKRALDSKNPVLQLAFQELRDHIAEELRELRGLSKTDGVVPTSIDVVATIRANRAKMIKDGFKGIDRVDEINNKVEAEAEKIQLENESGRVPNALTFEPGIGPTGNIMGKIFPKNVWALTYDDGPSPVTTPIILKNLETLGHKATFFWLAQHVLKNQTIVDDAKAKGMALANHSWSHAQLTKLDDAGLNKEILQSSDAEEKAYGHPIRFFRCPYGAGNSVSKIRGIIAKKNMIHAFWNVDTLDWQDKDPDSIVRRAQAQMKANGRGVVLFHDIHQQSVIASKKLLEWSNTFKGTPEEIRWVTLPEIVDEMNAGK